jgi:hypothetical protein
VLQGYNPSGNPDATWDVGGDAFYWQDYMGALEYVRQACRLARKYGPEDVVLFINDYNLESDWDDNKKLKSLINWIKKWESDGVTKIDGIGTQMHVSYYENSYIQNSKKEHITKMFQLMAASGKLVRVSEMDMGYVDANGNELRLSSIDDKDTRPICFISYNQSGYSSHCRLYAEYQTWVKERNPKRYESNLDKNYDSKNMMHCFRLMHMAGEIAEGKGMILQRTWDRQFLMDVRNHKFEYEEIIERLEEEKERMNQLMEQSTIREQIDTDLVNQLMIDIRKKQFEM